MSKDKIQVSIKDIPEIIEQLKQVEKEIEFERKSKNLFIDDLYKVCEISLKQSQEIERLNYKINKLDEYLHKMLNATKGKYHQAIQETIWFLNMLKEYRGEDIVK